MAAEDIVVDTNVLAHCDNDEEPRHGISVHFAKKLIASTTVMRLDPGFDPDPAKNRSLIGAEYLKHLRFGSLGFSVVVQLATAQRVMPCAHTKNQATNRAITQLLRNTRDRTFLRVAIASADRLLVSHDYVDFQKKKRTEIKKKFGVNIMEADVAETMV